MKDPTEFFSKVSFHTSYIHLPVVLCDEYLPYGKSYDCSTDPSTPADRAGSNSFVNNCILLLELMAYSYWIYQM